jgi:hypothetical protein
MHMGRELTALEEIVISKQTAEPGCWDGKFSNYLGEVYSEALHGHNPFGQGFCICTPTRAQTRAQT